jgi:hypothetical protein
MCALEQPFDGGAEFWQVIAHCGGEDGVRGVEVAVRQSVAQEDVFQSSRR